MTSTRFNVGLSDDTRSSSRVLRPPGGGHTDIFGGDPEPPRGRRLNPAAASACSLGEHANPPNSNGPTQNGGHEMPPPAAKPEAAPEPKAEAPRAEPEVAPAAPRSEPVQAAPRADPVQAAPEAPKRVRVPPGGFSSGLW